MSQQNSISRAYPEKLVVGAPASAVPNAPTPRMDTASLASDARVFTKPKKSRKMLRRLGVLAAAIAVPRAPEPQVIRFAMPQTIPYDPAAPLFGPEDAAETLPDEEILPEDAGIEDLNAGPAARGFSITGGHTTRMRAEQCLAMAIYYEAASEGAAGHRAVAQVVMNRVAHPTYPNNVCGVVFQGSERMTGCQFSFTCDGATARRPQQSIWRQAQRAARAALGGFVDPSVGLATHYHTLEVDPYWAASLDPVAVVGFHRFYKWRGSAGRRSAFSAGYDGYERSSTSYLANARRIDVEAELPDGALAFGLDSENLPTQSASLPATAELATSAVTTADQDNSNLPSGGDVLEPYANSGTWIRQPGS